MVFLFHKPHYSIIWVGSIPWFMQPLPFPRENSYCSSDILSRCFSHVSMHLRCKCLYVSFSVSLFQFRMFFLDTALISSHISPNNIKIFSYFSKMSQVFPSISEVIAARRCQMGSGPLAGAPYHAHSSDILKRCLQFPLLHCLPGAGGSPQLRCVHGLPSALASRHLHLCAFQLQRLVAAWLCWDRAGGPRASQSIGAAPVVGTAAPVQWECCYTAGWEKFPCG